jgi:hypothetical protein
LALVGSGVEAASGAGFSDDASPVGATTSAEPGAPLGDDSSLGVWFVPFLPTSPGSRPLSPGSPVAVVSGGVPWSASGSAPVPWSGPGSGLAGGSSGVTVGVPDLPAGMSPCDVTGKDCPIHATQTTGTVRLPRGFARFGRTGGRAVDFITI